MALRHHCIERGADSDMMFVGIHGALIEIWRGCFTDAAVTAQDLVERAEQLGGDNMLVIGWIAQAAVAAYTGNERDARAYALAAIEPARRCGSPALADWPITILGFLDVSLGNHVEALNTLQQLVFRLDQMRGTEIIKAPFIPDAVEAMIALGRLDEAEPLIERLEREGRRLDRSWMLAVGARCRSMWLAARGEVGAAFDTARQAMVEHERLPMPFERSRTQLLLGQLQRRQRHKEAAAATLGEALRAFEEMGTPLWAERARAELARTNVSPSQDTRLTPSEQKVAELVAAGMTNRDIGAALFISPKTVEHNLSRIYRKLGIRSRAELGRRMGTLSNTETPNSPGPPKH
jgi:DNA-binding CsgD family transcriptional regulator